MENFKMVAKTLFGFEDLLAQELTNLGARDVNKGIRMVSFSGDIGFMYKANLALRTAIKILKPISSFRLSSEQELYQHIYNMPWEEYLSENGSLAINATVHSLRFKHSQYIALKTKDAIADQFREKLGKRPNVDTEDADLKINVRLFKNLACLTKLNTFTLESELYK